MIIVFRVVRAPKRTTAPLLAEITPLTQGGEMARPLGWSVLLRVWEWFSRRAEFTSVIDD